MHEDSFILNPLGIPPIQIGREPLLVDAPLERRIGSTLSPLVWFSFCGNSTLILL